MNNAVLLVIDMQRGAFDGERCVPIDRPKTLVESARALVGAARAGGTPIVFVQHCDGAGKVFEEGSSHWQLHDALVPRRGDQVIRKYASSAFDGTRLASTLEGAQARELVLCGLQSEFCVANTARSALGKGFSVVVAQDGHRTWPTNMEPAVAISEGVNRDLKARGATLASTASLVRSLREPRHES
jgi:nicotinamidase-related amidase